MKADYYLGTHEKKNGVQIYLFQDNSIENIIDMKTRQCIGRYGVSKEEKKNRAANQFNKYRQSK
jgi:hypothetical protein